jgi:hypothetical protein
VARRRALWKRHQGNVDASRLIFIDETWAKTNMTPIRGGLPQGSAWLPKYRMVTGRR